MNTFETFPPLAGGKGRVALSDFPDDFFQLLALSNPVSYWLHFISVHVQRDPCHSHRIGKLLKNLKELFVVALDRLADTTDTSLARSLSYSRRQGWQLWTALERSSSSQIVATLPPTANASFVVAFVWGCSEVALPSRGQSVRA